MSTCVRRLLPVWLVGLVLLFPSTARGQFDAATVLGNLTDEQGAAVPGATVTLTNLATGIVATTVSEASGAYQFLNVRVGTYRIEAELQGFSKAVVPSVTVTVNARQRVDLTLKVGGLGETVEVTGVRLSLMIGQPGEFTASKMLPSYCSTVPSAVVARSIRLLVLLPYWAEMVKSSVT